MTNVGNHYKTRKMKITLLLVFFFTSISVYSQETVLIKNSGFGDLSILIKESGFGDITVLFKKSGFGDISVGITDIEFEADFILKHSGFGDRSVLLKDSGFGDISVLIKESGFGDVSVLIEESGTVDFLIYSDKDYITKDEIVAALIEVIKEKAGYKDKQ